MRPDRRVPSRLDHVVIGVPELAEGIRWFESNAGVRPADGGHHPALGTHNAIVGLGPAAYLEVLAVDPRHARANPTTEWLAHITRPTPFGWCLKSEDAASLAMDLTRRNATAQHLRLQRATPHGETLTCQVVLISHPLGPLMPFYIDWGAAPHPADTAPAGCRLTALTLQHPEPQPLHAALRKIGVEVDVEARTPAGMSLRLETPQGELEIAP